MVKIYIENRMLWSEIRIANTMFTRLIGLIRTQRLDPEQGLLIWPCKQIHCFHMKYAIDVIFIDQKMNVIAICSVEPGQISPFYRKSHYALEVTSGQARLYGIKAGDRLTIQN